MHRGFTERLLLLRDYAVKIPMGTDRMLKPKCKKGLAKPASPFYSVVGVFTDQ